jgi:hypothetical protein
MAAKQTLVRRALRTARIADRDEVEVMGWLSRRGALFFDDRLYVLKDPKRRSRPRRASKSGQ